MPGRPNAGGLARWVLAVAVVLASGGVGYTASRIWPLPTLSGTALKIPLKDRSSRAAEQEQPGAPASAPAVHKPGLAVIVPPSSASAEGTLAAQPAPGPITPEKLEIAGQPEPRAAAPLPTLALIPPSPVQPSEGNAEPEAPRTSTQSEAGKQDANKRDTRPVNAGATTPARPAKTRTFQPSSVQLPPPAPKAGYLQDKAMREFMSYPSGGY